MGGECAVEPTVSPWEDLTVGALVGAVYSSASERCSAHFWGVAANERL